MILLDSMFVSEPLKASGDTNVLAGSTRRSSKRCTSRQSVSRNCASVSLCCQRANAGMRFIPVLNSASCPCSSVASWRLMTLHRNPMRCYARARSCRRTGYCTRGWLYRCHCAGAWVRDSHARHVASCCCRLGGHQPLDVAGTLMLIGSK